MPDRTHGTCYTILEVANKQIDYGGWYLVSKDSGMAGKWELYQINGEFSAGRIRDDKIAFLPLARLSEKEQFIYRMSGKLP